MTPRFVPLILLVAANGAGAEEVARYAAGPGLEVVERREVYDLDAVTLPSLLEQLDAHLGGAESGDESVGRTVQRIETRYTLDLGADGCHLRDLSVRLRVTIHLPRWRPSGRRPATLGARWDRMLAALTRHEEGHRDNAVWAARELHRRLAGLGTAPTCLELERTVQRERFKMKLRNQQRDRTYDRLTGHGVRQGVVL
jgi:predicted secreted Zn-dependent protease